MLLALVPALDEISASRLARARYVVKEAEKVYRAAQPAPSTMRLPAKPVAARAANAGTLALSRSNTFDQSVGEPLGRCLSNWLNGVATHPSDRFCCLSRQ